MRHTSHKRRAGLSRATAYRAGETPTKAATVAPVDETHLECPKCHAGVRVRLDGTLFGHAIGGGGTTMKKTPCLGSGEFPLVAVA